MDAACCLPYLQAHSLGIHSVSQIDFSCPLFKLPPIAQLPGEAGICWGTSIKPVESLLFISNQFHKFVFATVVSFRELTSSSWIHEFWRKWTKGTEKANSELNCVVCLTPTCINNFRRRITELWKGPAYCWTGTSALGINRFQVLQRNKQTYSQGLISIFPIYLHVHLFTK